MVIFPGIAISVTVIAFISWEITCVASWTPLPG